MKRFAVIIAALALICAVALNCSAATNEVKVGTPAPDFTLTTLDGETIRLSDLRGKVVLINFWATWCPPCVGEMPDIQKLSEDYKDDLVVLGIDMYEDEQTVRDFIEAGGYTYTIGIDVGYQITMGGYYSKYIPYTVVVDRKGNTSAVHTGSGYEMYEVFEGYILEAM